HVARHARRDRRQVETDRRTTRSLGGESPRRRRRHPLNCHRGRSTGGGDAIANPETFINPPPLRECRGCFIRFLGQPEAEKWIPLSGKSSVARGFSRGSLSPRPRRWASARKTPNSSGFSRA